MQKLYKSDTDKMLDGVCGGIAKYFQIDPVIVRLLWIVGTIIGHIFWGVVAYLVAMMIIPKAPHSKGATGEEGGSDHTNRTHIWIGVGLIGLGGLFLLQNISGIHVLSYLGQFFPYVWPAILIILGIMLMMRTSGGEEK